MTIHRSGMRANCGECHCLSMNAPLNLIARIFITISKEVTMSLYAHSDILWQDILEVSEAVTENWLMYVHVASDLRRPRHSRWQPGRRLLQVEFKPVNCSSCSKFHLYNMEDEMQASTYHITLADIPASPVSGKLIVSRLHMCQSATSMLHRNDSRDQNYRLNIS
jgi:hypothetical protein